MSLTHTLSSAAPRLCRRQTSIGVEHHRRAGSPQRHMRLVSAYAALPSMQEASSSSTSLVESGSITPPRKRSASASWTPRIPPPSPRPQSRAQSPSPLSIRLPSPYVPRGSSPYSPRTPYSPRSMRSQPASSPSLSAHSSYFPSAPASPVLPAAVATVAPPPPPPARAPSPPPSPPPLQQAYSLPARGTLPPPLSAAGMGVGMGGLEMFPSISSPLPRSQAELARVPDKEQRPQLRVESGRFAHVISVPLPGYTPDEVTITVSRTDSLKLVADRWSAAADDKCHVEWLVTFAPRDANMTSIHAAFADSTLCITVPRLRPSDDLSSRVSLMMA